jgi:hypothetical protein
MGVGIVQSGRAGTHDQQHLRRACLPLPYHWGLMLLKDMVQIFLLKSVIDIKVIFFFI